MSEIRIAHIQGSSRIGGSQVHTQMLIEGLEEKGFINYLILSEEGVFKHFIKKNNMPHTVINMGQKYNLRTGLNISRWCRKNKIDIVHTHLRNADFHGLLGGLLARCPVRITTLHGTPNSDGTTIKKNISGYVYGKLLSTVPDRIITISQFMYNRTIEVLPGTRHQLVTIYNGTDYSLFDEIYYKKTGSGSSHPLCIGFVGRLTSRKRPLSFVRILKKISEIFPGAKGIMIGDGPEKKKVENEINRLNLSDKISLTGYLTGIKDIYKDIDIMLFTAVDEPFGRVLTESMSAGIPVVAADSGAVPEIISSNETGLLYPPRSENEAVSHISLLIENNDKRNDIIRKARAHVENKFSSGIFVDKTAELYTRLLNSVISRRG